MDELSRDRKPVEETLDNEDPFPGLLRKKHRMKDGVQRICRVCGDKAVAHNFDVITCESCKTFFRRNALKPQKECTFEGKCEITVNTRRFCPACRLKKCFVIGMRADMILDEGERKARMDKITENRKKRKLEAAKHQTDSRHGNGNRTVSGGGEPSSQSECECDSSRSGWVVSDLETGNSSHDECAPDFLSREAPDYQHSDQTSDPVPMVFEEQGEGQMMAQEESVSNRRKCASSFEHVPVALLPSDPLMYWRLTAEEHMLLTKLTIDYKETLLVMPPTPPHGDIAELDLDGTLAHCEHFATDMVNFIKRLPDFRSLELNDQLAAIKGNGMRCLLVKGAACFSEERDAWLKDIGEIPVSTFMRVSKHEDLVWRFAEFSRTLKRILKNDLTSFALLHLVALFEPQAARLFDRQKVNMLHDKYGILFKHHLESQYSYMFAGQYLEAVWDCLNDSKVLAVDMINMFNKWKDMLGPLLVEVINLQ